MVSEQGGRDFALIYRWLDDADELHKHLLVVITDVPLTEGEAQVKNVINATGHSLLEGFREPYNEELVDWQKGYKLVPAEQWDEKLKALVDRLEENATQTDMEYDGVRVSSPKGENDWLVLTDEDKLEFSRLVAYSTLLDALRGEMRITLRLPVGLHGRLVREANLRVSSSLNSFCVAKLAEAVDYEEEELKAFEAQRRKPGRPKKSEAVG